MLKTQSHVFMVNKVYIFFSVSSLQQLEKFLKLNSVEFETNKEAYHTEFTKKKNNNIIFYFISLINKKYLTCMVSFCNVFPNPSGG